MTARQSNPVKIPISDDLIITRIFDAPREAVWKAWTDPEHMMRWWGPKEFTAPACKIDLRVGGKYLFCMRSPEGQDYWSTGVYREIVPMERLVCTDSFSDEKGNVVPASHYGMQGEFPPELLVTVTFEEDGGKTYLTKFKDEYKIYNLQGIFNALILKDLTGAEKSLQKSLSIKENYIALTNLGSCYWDLNNLKTAKIYFEKAIKFDVKEELAHINLINLLIAEQKFNQALDHINESEKYVSNNGAPYLYQKGWLLLKNGQPEAALKWNLNVIKSYPDNYRLYNNIGNCYEKLNNTEEAFKNYLKSINLSKKIKLGPDDLKQYYNALILADSQMDNDKIIYIANQLLAVDQSNILALYTVALAKIRNKKFEESKDYLKKIIKINPTFHNAYVSLSFIYTEIDDNQEDAILLLESADKIVDKTDQGDGFYNNLAYAYIKNGLLDEAEKTLSLTNNSGYANSTAALLELYKGHENKYATLFKNSFNKFKENEISFAMQSFYFEEAYYNATIKNDNKKALKLIDEVIKINVTSFYADKARKLMKQIPR